MANLPDDLDHTAPPSEYPEDHLVAVLKDQEQLRAVMTALADSGFLPSDIDVSWGPEAAAAFREGVGRGGITGAAMRFARWLGITTEELRFRQRYEEALDRGDILVAVSAPTEERKVRAADLLRANGAELVMYLGKYTMRSVSPPGVAGSDEMTM
jgi:hypothetical protein